MRSCNAGLTGATVPCDGGSLRTIRPRTSAARFRTQLALTIELANWDHVPVGFIQTSAIHDHSAAEARRRNWPVARLHGTHLHPTLHPAETADAIIAMSSSRSSAVSPVLT